MFKWLGKQFAYGRIYLWAKERLSGLLLTIILLIFLSLFFGHIIFVSSLNRDNDLIVLNQM